MNARNFMLSALLSASLGGGALAEGLGDGAATNASPSKAPSAAFESSGAGGVAAGGSAQLFAAVNADGALASSKGVISSGYTAGVPGYYEVFFARTITACVFTATLGSTVASEPSSGFVVVALRSGSSNGVYVRTEDQTGVVAGRSFNLWVNC